MSSEPEDTPPPGEDRTVFSPATGFAAIPPQPVAAAPYPPAGYAPAAGAEPRRIQIGDVLNHIFEVRRFLARGGMGEVFEGINVNSEERVAIKVILPHLAADPAVQAMFRKEARTLTRLSHPALVQYRVLAQEPQLGVFYIVTEFIEGQNLSDILRDINCSPADLAKLTKRLAEGLSAAHTLGAIHRDISPDNVIAEEGKLDKAKIIDFGIAKDLDASTGTIVGDGFAGKLNYVAPEQLGDFDRAVGPWTDVYSLGLLILAVAQRKDVNMGGSLVDAVDKRRAGPDLSTIPANLRPVLEKMLKPNPADRARSMDEVLELLANPALAQAGHAPVLGASAAGTERPAKEKSVAAPGSAPGLVERFGARNLAIGGGVAALAAIGLGVTFFSGGSSGPAPASTGAAAVAPGDPLASAREAIGQGMPNIACAWLDMVDVEAQGDTVSASFRGVAGKPPAAQAQISALLAAKGLKAGTIDFNDVSPISASECAPIEAFRQVRAPGAARLTVPQRSFEMVKLGPEAGALAGRPGAVAVIEIDAADLPSDLALVGIEESGTMTELVASKQEIAGNAGIQQVRPGVYRIPLTTTHMGWSGILMLTGQAPFDAKLLSGPAGSRGADWAQRFLQAAREKGWKAEMVWYRTVDTTPNG